MKDWVIAFFEAIALVALALLAVKAILMWG